MTRFLTTIAGYLGYRGQEGYWSYLLHRITGLATVMFLSFHILDTAFVYFAPWLYEDIMALFRSTLFGLGEIVLVFCVFYHGVNGLRIMIFDLVIPKYWQISSERISVRVMLGITLLIWIPAATIMSRNLLIHNFGMFGG